MRVEGVVGENMLRLAERTGAMIPTEVCCRLDSMMPTYMPLTMVVVVASVLVVAHTALRSYSFCDNAFWSSTERACRTEHFRCLH